MLLLIGAMAVNALGSTRSSEQAVRSTTEIAEVLLVELRPTCSAALIVNVAPKQSIRAGDIASIKVLKS